MQEYVTSCVCVCVCVCVCMQGSYSALLHQLGQLATSCYNRLAGFTFTIVVTVAAVVSATVLLHTSLTHSLTCTLLCNIVQLGWREGQAIGRRQKRRHGATASDRTSVGQAVPEGIDVSKLPSQVSV